MIEIKQVFSKKEQRRFAGFANVLYRRNPYYVPELEADVIASMNPSTNPAHEFCEVCYFLAYDGITIVGRIGLILNRKSNQKWNQKYVRFTCFDFIDDYEVSEALMQKAILWAETRGMEGIHGPLGFTDLDHQGLLVEGFDEMDLFITIYNAPYYVNHMERLGFVKDVDWVECQLKLDITKAKRLSKIADHLIERNGFELIEFKNKKEILPWAERVFDLYNTAYAPLYGTTDLDKKQIEVTIKTFFGYVNPDFIKVVVDKSGELAGFSIAMPSLSRAMQRARGKLFPFGFLHILKAIRKNSVLDLYLIAVDPKYHDTGLNALMLNSIMKTAIRYGMTHAETGPMLESNQKVQSQWRFFEVRQHRRRRVYKKMFRQITSG